MRQWGGAAGRVLGSRPVRIARRAGHYGLVAIMWTIVAVAVLVGAVLQSGGVRSRLAGAALQMAAPRLPGEVAVGEIAWPELGHLRLTDVVWTGGAAADTLLDLARLELWCDLQALRQEDVRIDSLRVDVRWLDAPASVELLGSLADTTAGAAPDTAAATPTFPRPGAIPGVPSLALGDGRFALGRARLTPTEQVRNVVLRTEVEAGAGHEGRLRVRHLGGTFRSALLDSVTGEPWEIVLGHLGVGLSLSDAGGDEGLVAARLDSLNVHFDHIGAVGAPSPESGAGGLRTRRPLQLHNTGRLERTAAGLAGHLVSDFVLPGPADVAVLLPAGFPAEEFGRLHGRLRVDADVARPLIAVDVDLDLGATDWLEAGRLVASSRADVEQVMAGDRRSAVVQLDTLALAWQGASIAAAGRFVADTLDFDLVAGLEGTRLAEILAPRAAARVDSGTVSLRVGLAAAGTLFDPTVSLQGEGRFRTDEASLPALRLAARGTRDGGRLELHLPAGLAWGETRLDSLDVGLDVARSAGDSLRADFAVGVWSGALRAQTAGSAHVDSLGLAPVRTLSLDSLVVADGDHRIRLREPVRVVHGPQPGDLDVSTLALTGEPGLVELTARARSDTLALTALVDLDLPEALLQRLAPAEFWSADGGRDVTVDASLAVSGTRRSPELAGDAQVRLVPHRDEPNLGADLTFSLAAGDSAGVVADMAIVSADTAGLAARLVVPGRLDPQTGRWLMDPDRPTRLDVPEQQLGLSRLNRLLPDDVSLSGLFTVAATAVVGVANGGDGAGADSLATEQAPRLTGTVDGRLATPKLEIRLPYRSRLELRTDIALAGPLADPRVSGTIEVPSAFFRIPELPKALHPTEGQPALWALAAADSGAAAADTVAVFVRPEAKGPVLEAKGPAVLPDLDLKVTIPGNFRVHGYGLDVELAGDLQVDRGHDEDGRPQPRIVGDVRAVEGTLQFMNRVFRVERGDIGFHGAVPADPVLDMLLEADVSGTLVRIAVTGTAADPQVTLSSEPEYEEQDIVAVLLFGRPMNELDTDQRGGVRQEGDAGQQLRQNMAALAMVFGTAGLQNSVSETFGVDMVEVGSGSEGDSTLMVGKFIAPNLILKYNHSLEKSGTYFLTMEYALTRIFKLVSTYGQGEEDSGLELRWSKRY